MGLWQASVSAGMISFQEFQGCRRSPGEWLESIVLFPQRLLLRFDGRAAISAACPPIRVTPGARQERRRSRLQASRGGENEGEDSGIDKLYCNQAETMLIWISELH